MVGRWGLVARPSLPFRPPSNPPLPSQPPVRLAACIGNPISAPAQARFSIGLGLGPAGWANLCQAGPVCGSRSANGPGRPSAFMMQIAR